MADREGLPRALREAAPVDLAHYDSDKSPQGRAFAYAAIWQALREGGILVSDDVGDKATIWNSGVSPKRWPGNPSSSTGTASSRVSLSNDGGATVTHRGLGAAGAANKGGTGTDYPYKAALR